MPSAATLAGSTSTCPTKDMPVLGGPTSSNVFCNLGAIETSLDGEYVLLADGGKLLRFNLFTDQGAGVIAQLPASIVTEFKSICSIGVLAPDGAIAVHDCGASQIYIAMADGTHVQLAMDFSTLLAAPRLSLKSYYNRVERYMVTAGAVLQVDSVDAPTCLAVYGVTISEFSADFYSQATPSLLANIPCTIYGVWEGGGRLTSFDARGMEPHLITRERCPSTFRAGQWCYCVYMQRAASLEFLRAYVPEEGGIDLQYYASTQNLYDNALGAPLIRTGGVNASNDLVYTLRGACLQIDSLLLTSGGKTPSSTTLGNTCRRAPQLGARCTLPLNNPFITDVMTSPVLLPNGLSATHTHAELAAIFDADCPHLSNVTRGGPFLYQSTLANVYGNTTPVDFVELAGTLDVIYITPTSVGLISTKRILFQDRLQPGYARATNLIYCPMGSFGSVGGVCARCEDASAKGYYTSIAWQIQCVGTQTPYNNNNNNNKDNRAAGSAPPYETFTIVATRNVTIDTIHTSVCVFTESKGVACPPLDQVSMLTPQQFNLAADALESDLQLIRPSSSSPASSTEEERGLDLIQCLLHDAEAKTGRVLRRANPAEYNARIISMDGGLRLLQADAVKTSDFTAANYSDSDLGAAVANACGNSLVRGLGSFLACTAQLSIIMDSNTTTTTATSTNASAPPHQQRRRRLLQVASSVAEDMARNNNDAPPPQSTVEHHGVAMGSSTIISWRRAGSPLQYTTDTVPAPPPSDSKKPATDNASDFEFPLWMGLTVGAACATVLTFLFYLIYRRQKGRSGGGGGGGGRYRPMMMTKGA